MEEERGNGSSSSRNLDTGKAESPVWLMKCPVVVAKSWNSHNPSDPHPLSKVVLSLDPLHADDPSSLEVLITFFLQFDRFSEYTWCAFGVLVMNLLISARILNILASAQLPCSLSLIATYSLVNPNFCCARRLIACIFVIIVSFLQLD